MICATDAKIKSQQAIDSRISDAIKRVENRINDVSKMGEFKTSCSVRENLVDHIIRILAANGYKTETGFTHGSDRTITIDWS